MSSLQRRRLRISGTVQGVGFRPFVHGVATALGLHGEVWNDGTGVLVDAAGPVDRLELLSAAIAERPPRLARVGAVAVEACELVAGLPERPTFRIRPSAPSVGAAPTIPPDSATCDACLAEVADPAARRHRYPFTNCTDCGPRYTIVTALPYDRPATTMAAFEMCELCRAEYDDPTDRRHHAQPIACPTCGPQLRLLDAGRGRAGGAGVGPPEAEGDAALAGAVAALRSGMIVAVKGLGGYHLAVDATDDEAVGRLRKRKHRDHKPFAVMVADLDAACRLAHLDGDDAVRLLAGPAAPVLVAPARSGNGLAPSVAPGLGEVGLVLAYTPLHRLLLEGADRPLVMTSGNVSDDPIVHDDADAASTLAPLVDRLLAHDRPIHVRCDDSVVRTGPAGWQVLRRSRGWAPTPLALPVASPVPVLAVGAELKATVAVGAGDQLTLSHHLGDLTHLGTYTAFLQALDHLPRLLQTTPAVIAHDLHPEYLSSKWAAEQGLPLEGVQHHHAHAASCLVEHGRASPVVALTFDGSGWGPDGTVWGGEVLVADLVGFERVGHLRPAPLPGGAAAVREPWRMAAAWAWLLDGDDGRGGECSGDGEGVRPGREQGAATEGRWVGEVGARLDPRWPAVVGLCGSPTTVWTSSVGRLFDAVAAILDLRLVAGYEGQAAMELEDAARRGAARLLVDPAALVTPGPPGPAVIDPAPLVRAVLDGLRRSVPVADLAAGFHLTLAQAAAAVAVDAAEAHDIGAVALSGGVFQNQLLSAAVSSALARAGVQVLRHQSVPANDGGIAAGQAAVAAARLAGRDASQAS